MHIGHCCHTRNGEQMFLAYSCSALIVKCVPWRGIWHCREYGCIQYADSALQFAVDMEGLYGGEALAQKAASLELKGQRSYWRFLFETGESRLRIPLFSLIDFAGFRLIATSLLPIYKSTLKYGSADAGRTVHKDIPELSEIMKAAAKHIGMKVLQSPREGVLCSIACRLSLVRFQ